VLPWLLDKTPLPAMMEIQGITTADGTEAAAVLEPKLGWTFGLRRMLQALVAVLMLAAVGFAGWYLQRSPPPWELRGEITGRQTRMPIAGVEVVVETGAGEKRSVYTDGQGTYVLRLPQPQPKSVHVLFCKEGYEAEPALNVSTSKPFDTDMAKLP